MREDEGEGEVEGGNEMSEGCRFWGNSFHACGQVSFFPFKSLATCRCS